MTLPQHERDALTEAAHHLLGEMRDVIHHQSGEPGDWWPEAEPDDVLMREARELSRRMAVAAQGLARVCSEIERNARLRGDRS